MTSRSLREAHTPQPPVLRGFEAINRYWDRQNELWAAKILPGEYYVTTHEELIVTVLGSCISACIRDPIFGIGGMNHFMLPSSTAAERYGSMQVSDATRYGNYAMEHLINDILKLGGRRENLELKLFGGGKVMARLSDVGLRNIEFVQEYVETECLNVVAHDMGDIFPRKILYNPITGKVRMKKLRSMHNDTILVRETRYMQELKQQSIAGAVELF